jgi:hypothetical protein
MPPFRAVAEVIVLTHAPEVIPGIGSTAIVHEAVWEGDNPPTFSELQSVAYRTFAPDLTTGEVPAIDPTKLDTNLDPEMPATRRPHLLIQEQSRRRKKWQTIATVGVNVLLANED